MNLNVILRLGRISNLPTVWTNALAGAVIAVGGAPDWGAVIAAGLALSLFYEGGMWLNDAFDAEIDAAERADRPIPNGEVSRTLVFAGGWAMLAAGIAISFWISALAGLVGLALAGAVVLYDWLHKRTALSPVIMGATRFFSYLLAAVAAAGTVGPAVIGALGLLAYVVGLTYAAKQEAYDRLGAAWPLGVLAAPLLYAVWLGLAAPAALIFAAMLAALMGFALMRLFRRAKGDVPVAVVTLIAGISLYDAALIAASGSLVLGVVAFCGFLATLALQRVASGT